LFLFKYCHICATDYELNCSSFLANIENIYHHNNFPQARTLEGARVFRQADVIRNYLKLLLKISSILILTACGLKPNGQSDTKSFVPPFIFQETTIDTFTFFNEEYISCSITDVVGKYVFCDTLKLSTRADFDTTFYKELYGHDYLPLLDSFEFDGLEIFTDYKINVSKIIRTSATSGNFYYPVYIVNQTPNIKLFVGKDSYVFAIQEALDEYGHWWPIEGRAFDFCGNGYWGLKINPNEFLTVLFPKYEGDFKTKIRVRIKNQDIIYVSKPFDGIINKSQFILEKENDYDLLYSSLVENKASAIENLFYNSEPLEFSDKNIYIK
jgi:hypothetical protein